MAGFEKSVAIVTGAASGIGRAVSEGLARRGALVVLTDVNGEGARTVAEAIRSAGGTAEAQTIDVTSAEEMQRIVDDTVARHGRLDYMFNNAGIAIAGEVRDMQIAHWRRIVEINVMGVVHGIAAAYPVMIRQGSGHIVNTASVAGLVATPTMAAYAMTKHAVVGLSRSLRHEASGLGVKVSAVCPGFIRTPIIEATLALNVRPQDFLERIPFKWLEADQAAVFILRGVEHNQELIVFPAYARMMWWMNKLLGGLMGPFFRRMVGDVRAGRT